jgi:hypothetical protein
LRPLDGKPNFVKLSHVSLLLDQHSLVASTNELFAGVATGTLAAGGKRHAVSNFMQPTGDGMLFIEWQLLESV